MKIDLKQYNKKINSLIKEYQKLIKYFKMGKVSVTNAYEPSFLDNFLEEHH